VATHAVEVWNDSAWKAIAEGTTVGYKRSIVFRRDGKPGAAGDSIGAGDAAHQSILTLPHSVSTSTIADGRVIARTRVSFARSPVADCLRERSAEDSSQ
jgi:hypothetical protein